MRGALVFVTACFLMVVLVDRWEDRVYSARVAALQDSLDVARTETARRDTIYVRDTIRYRETRVRWDSVRITDTVIVDSVVYVNRDVADSTVKACDDALASCGSLVLGLRSELALTRDALDVSRDLLASQKRKGLWEKLGVGLVGFGAGSLACKM